MATDTAPPAQTPDAPVAPPAAAPKVLAPDPALQGLPPAEVRRNALLKAFEQRTTPELAPEPPAAPKEQPKEPPKAAAKTAKAQVDTTAESAHTEPQAQAPASEPPTPAPASTDAPAGKATPQAAAPPQSGDTPPPAEATPSEAAPKRGIPAEFLTPEHEAVYKADPLAKREVARLYGDPNLSDVQKAVKAAERIDAAKTRISERQQKQAERRALREQGNFEELGRLHAAELDEHSLSAEAEAVVTRLLATVAGTTPDDAGFLTAGNDAETDEDRYAAWGRWLAKESPVGREILADLETQVAQRKDAEIAQLKTQFAEEKKALEDKFKDDLATAVEKARSEARAGNPPPRSNIQLAPVDEYVRPQAPGIRSARDLIAAGLSARDDASNR